MKVILSPGQAEKLKQLKIIKAFNVTPIQFFSKEYSEKKSKAKKEKDDDDEKMSTDMKKFVLAIDLRSAKTAEVSQYVKIFGEDPTPEGWCKH